MPKPPNRLRPIIAEAAGLRAAGQSWESVAKALRRKAETIRRWPVNYADAWDDAFRSAQEKIVTEAAAEAVLMLRKLLREADDKTSKEAARELLRFTAGLRQALPASKPNAPTERSELRTAAGYLESLDDGAIQDLIDELAARHDPDARPDPTHPHPANGAD